MVHTVRGDGTVFEGPMVLDPDPDPVAKPRAKPRRKPARRTRREPMPAVLSRPVYDDTPEPAPMTAIDRATGGSVMQGRKTLIGVTGLALVSLAQTWGWVDNPETIATAQAVFAALAGLGVASKIERAKL